MERVTKAEKLGMSRINFFGSNLNRLYGIRYYALGLKAEELIAIGGLLNPGNGDLPAIRNRYIWQSAFHASKPYRFPPSNVLGFPGKIIQPRITLVSGPDDCMELFTTIIFLDGKASAHVYAGIDIPIEITDGSTLFPRFSIICGKGPTHVSG